MEKDKALFFCIKEFPIMMIMWIVDNVELRIGLAHTLCNTQV